MFEGGEMDTQTPMIDEKLDSRRSTNHMKRQRLMEEKQEQADNVRHRAKLQI